MVRELVALLLVRGTQVSIAGQRSRSLREVSVRCELCGERSNFPQIVLTAVQDGPDSTGE
jgi:hypothetical protein